MKLRLLSSSFIILVTALVCAARAQAPAAAAEHAAPAAPAEQHTELEEKMSAIGKAFKKLRGQVGDPSKNEDSLKLVAGIHENAIAAAKLPPAKKNDVPAADQAKFQADYEAGMKNFIADVASLEAALKAGNNEEAKKLTEKLGSDQKEGHKEFRKKKPEKK